MSFAIRLLLVGALLGGLIMLVPAMSVLQQRKAEWRQLHAEVGSMDVDDPTQAAIKLLPTDDRLHFRWLLYLPPEVSGLQWSIISGGSSISGGGTAGTEPQTHLIQARFRKVDEQWMLWTQRANGGGTMSLQPEAAQAIEEGSYIVEHYAANETLQTDFEQVVTLLAIRHKLTGEPLTIVEVGTKDALDRRNKADDNEQRN